MVGGVGYPIQAQPTGRPKPPDLSTKLRPSGGRGVEGFCGRPSCGELRKSFSDARSDVERATVVPP